MPSLVDLIKKAAVEAVSASKPSDIVYGKVTSTSPLKIQVDQKLTIDDDFIKLTRNVTDYDIDMTINHVTESTSGGSGESSFAAHSHGYVGKKTFTVHNALKIGDIVAMIMVQGGQSYIVIDKVVS